MAEIARAAGVVASVLYDHYAGKQQLYADLVQIHSDRLIAAAAQPLDTNDPREQFRGSVEAFFETVEKDPFTWRVLFRDPPESHEAATAYRNGQQAATDAIALLVGAFAPPAPLPGVDRDELIQMVAEGVKSTLNGLAAWWWDHRSAPRSQVVEVATALVWPGLEHLLDEAANS